MWCAWHLAETAPDARIVLLEADLCGHGPSGRNGGFCHGNWLSLAPLRDRLGAGPALELARATQAGAEAIGRWCEEQGVDAWYRRGGELRVSTTEAHDDVGLASARAADELGVGDRLVDLTPAQVREHCDSPVFRRGVFAPDGATVHPGRLALGSAGEADRPRRGRARARAGAARARGGRGRCQRRDRGGAYPRGARGARGGRGARADARHARAGCSSGRAISSSPSRCRTSSRSSAGAARRSATPARSSTTPARRTTGGSRSAGPAGGRRSAAGCAGASRWTPRSPRRCIAICCAGSRCSRAGPSSTRGAGRLT